MNISNLTFGATYPVTLQKLAPLAVTTATLLSFVGAPVTVAQSMPSNPVQFITAGTTGRDAAALT